MFQDDEIDPQLETIASLRQQLDAAEANCQCELIKLEQQLADATEVANLSDGMYRSAIRQLAEKDAGLEAATQIINQYASELDELQEQAIKDVNHFRTAAAEAQARNASDGWRQCAKGQRTTQYCGLTEEAIRQAKREALLEAAESFTCKTYGLVPHDLRRMAEEMK